MSESVDGNTLSADIDGGNGMAGQSASDAPGAGPDLTHPLLKQYAEIFAALNWPALIVDGEWRLSWVSAELLEFIRATDDPNIGYGLHIADALFRDPWISAITQDSLGPVFADVGPYLLHDLESRGRSAREALPEGVVEFLETMKSAEPPGVFRTGFLAVDREDPELPPYPVDVCGLKLRDENGEVAGWATIMFIGVRPKLLSLLARGDEEMYERMAQLIDPGPRQAAILFCDLASSGSLSKRLPSINYFRLMRELWTGIDQAVAENTGIVGKHAGDGASAYFLVDDLGTRSEAATAALVTARRIQELAEKILDGEDGDNPLRVGVHWGGSLYMGQLVPGGRLDVTALGDEVNQASRVQEVADAGEILVSKQLLEQLSPADGARIGIDLEKISYRLIGEIAPAESKVLRDAGNLPVTSL